MRVFIGITSFDGIGKIKVKIVHIFYQTIPVLQDLSHRNILKRVKEY